MLSDQTNGKQFLDNIEQTTVKLRQTSARLDTLIARFDKANGILPQLMENKDFSDDVLPNLRQSSHDLKDILQKINSGERHRGPDGQRSCAVQSTHEFHGQRRRMGNSIYQWLLQFDPSAGEPVAGAMSRSLSC